MSFFDKEEVFNIVLTPLGKKQATQGVFDPKFYQFFDDSVIYNPESFKVNETQNESAQRIKDIQFLKPQKSKNDVGKENISIEENDNNLLSYPLGMADFETQLAPSWNVSFNKGFIVSIEEAEERRDRIPQLNTEITYKYIYSNNGSFKPTNNDSDEILFQKDLNNNTTLYILEQNRIDVDIKEENTVFNKINYEIETYIIEQNIDSEEYLVPILTKYDQEEQEKLLKYYFSVSADGKSLTLEEDVLQELYKRFKEEENSISLIDTNYDDAEKPC